MCAPHHSHRTEPNCSLCRALARAEAAELAATHEDGDDE